MLSAQARPLIAATVPILREHGLAITRHFYQRMLGEHPELKNLFNQGNQAGGEQQQALAGAVYAYAANIDRPEVLAPVLERIAHKHASLGITPAQYTIVGKHLLASIGEVLGDAVTPAIAAAWDEAYWLLAVELIAREARLYHAASLTPDSHWQQLKVVARQPQGELAESFTLAREDGQPLPAFRPGQYVSVALNLPAGGLRQIRQYSLSGAPGDANWQITVKREGGNEARPAGAVSNLLLDTVKRGDLLDVGPAFGDFVLDEAETGPVVLISAGVGVTPMVSMLHSLSRAQQHRPVVFVHAARNGRQHVLRDAVAELAERHPGVEQIVFYEAPHADDRDGVDYDHKGRMALETIREAVILPDASYYLCGPLPFMREQRRALMDCGVDVERIRYEVFGPDLLAGMA